MISLGCAKNLVDAEIMLGSLLKSGYQVTNDPGQADVLIVNTCSFIDAAQEESVDTILESSTWRDQTRPDQGLIVSGCLPQRFRDELPKLMPEVDAFMGIDQVADVAGFVEKARERRARRLAMLAARPAPLADPGATDEEGDDEDEDQDISAEEETEPAVFDVTKRPVYIPDYQTPRFRLTPDHFSYVKIAEGCNHPCSFCIIPRMRGMHRSRQQADIVQEVRALVADGVKEVNLISQDSTYYGMDLRPDARPNIASPEKFTGAARDLPADAVTLSTLLRELNAIEGDFWIRLLYTHPAHWTDELITTMAECSKVARYVDMPLQHIHPTMLERMRRETSREYIEELIQRIRKGIPGIAIRTTFIVGFPGETEEYFQSLLDFITETRFERLGVFTYSHEEGTKAGKMSRQWDEEEKERRRAAAMERQLQVSRSLSSSQLGRTLRVLIEGPADAEALEQAEVRSWEHGLIRQHSEKPGLEGDWMVARGHADAPDIDGRVYVRGHDAEPGTFVDVRVIGHSDYDLMAELILP